MMTSGEDESSTYSFTRRTVSEKTDTELEYESFFRTPFELEKELTGNARLGEMIYLANLRRTETAFVLKSDFLCLLDADWNGNLREIQKENFVFLKLLKCINSDGNKHHLPLCLRCNLTDRAEVLMASIKPDVKVSKIFKEDNFAACIHANVAEILFTKEECIKENSSQTRCKVVVTDAKQHLAISFDGNTHGLIFANIARGAKRGRCLRCQSIRCPHIQAWNLELKKVLINVTKVDSEAGTCDRENEGSIGLVDVNNENVNEEDFEDFLEEDESDVAEPTPTKKLMYPFQEDVQEKLRILDSSDLSDVTTFISFPADDGQCSHGNLWSHDDPRSHNWIQTNKVKIAHSAYVSKKERKLYFRRTVGSRKCKLLYNGSDDLFLSISENPNSTSSHNHGQRTANIVTYSLLIDFINDFFRNGVTMRGFHASYESKCTMKYGMKECDIITWKLWRLACIEFMTNIFTINEREAFYCSLCGPRPKALVIDGIAMGLKN